MKKLLKRFFNYIEKIYIKRHNWELVPGTEYGCVYIDILKHKGKDVSLSDGTIIKKGDTVVEVHINNKKMKDVSVRMVLKIFNSELKAMAKALRDNSEYADIKGVFGRTVLYPLNKKLGFEVFEITSKRMKLFIKLWDNLIKIAFSTRNKGKFIVREPKETWISREDLISKLDSGGK